MRTISQRLGEEDDASDGNGPADCDPCVSQRIGFEMSSCGNAPKQDTEKDKHRSGDSFADPLSDPLAMS